MSMRWWPSEWCQSMSWSMGAHVAQRSVNKGNLSTSRMRGVGQHRLWEPQQASVAEGSLVGVRAPVYTGCMQSGSV